nr:zinc metallopeptidase [uncultured Sellimonas sp.]
MPYFYFDPTYSLVLIGVIICMAASAKVRSTYAKYSQIRNHGGITGREAAEKILRGAGLYDVRIERVSGSLTDHYDPRSKVLRLSDSTYSSMSVAAVGVAAHECGHAIQHARGYIPLNLRSAIVPIANFGSAIAWPLIFLGLLINSRSSVMMINLGILAFSFAVLFQIVTLPVEFNASNRAIRILGDANILYPDELSAAKKVLGAAALTYVAGAASAILQLLRILILTGGRRDD